MKKIIIYLVLMNCSIIYAQESKLCTYRRSEKITGSSGYFYAKNEIKFWNDSTYKWTEKRYKDKKCEILIDSDVVSGKWKLIADTLYLYKNKFDEHKKEEYQKFYTRKRKIYYLSISSKSIKTNYKRYPWKRISLVNENCPL